MAIRSDRSPHTAQAATLKRWEAPFQTLAERASGASTAQPELVTRLERNGRSDALTRLPSRTLLLDRLDDAVTPAPQRATCVAIVLCDLDNFRLINESLGHAVGDDLLIAVARRFEQVLRAGAMVARLGGDEFAVLLDDVRAASEVPRIAERLQRALQEPLVLAGRDWHVTASRPRICSATRRRRCTRPSTTARIATPSSTRRCGQQ